MNNMSFNEFKENVKEEIERRLQKEKLNVKIEETVVEKNNGVKLTGLTIKHQGQIVAATIYLDSYYLNDNTVEFTARSVIEQGVYQKRPDVDVDMLKHFEEVKDKLLPRIVNLEKNKERLERTPHIIIDDLAVYFVVDIGKFNDGSLSVTVTDQLLQKWGVDKDEVYITAVDNLDKQDLCKAVTMADALGLSDMDRIINDTADNMYILTLRGNNYGAAAVLDKKFMADIADKIGKQFVLIPSSVHEWLAMPVDPKMTLPDDINAMVDQVNATEVDLEEQLSNHIYRYTEEKGLCCF